jgi:hypothetical protein
MNPMEELEAKHESERSDAGRAAYINWRMRDVPSIYSKLMPPTYDAKILIQAEAMIRMQIEEDQKHLSSPWRQIGLQCTILDFSGMTSKEQLEFACEVQIPVGFPDAVKPGREAEVADVTKFFCDRSQEYQQAIRDLKNGDSFTQHAIYSRMNPEDAERRRRDDSESAKALFKHQDDRAAEMAASKEHNGGGSAEQIDAAAADI